MKKFFFLFLFFVTFYRISLFYSWLYISLVLSSLYFLNVFFIKNQSIKISFRFVLFFISIFYFLIMDIFFGLDIDSMSLSVRLIFLFFMSIMPAYILSFEYIRGDYEKIVTLVKYSLWIQFLFWILTYISTDAKIYIYTIIGASDSVNLWEQNINARGFGISNEINFTSPSISVLLSFLFLNGFSLITGLNFITQLINSNLVVVSLFFGFFLSKIKFYKKIIIIILFFFAFFFIGIDYIPRLSEEIKSGGDRTLKILINDHLNFYNDGFFEWLFGAGEKVYGVENGSDIGWVILVNYYGVLSVFFVLIFIWNLSKNIFSENYRCVAWFLLGVILNIKGLIIGANAYMFITFLLLFNRNQLLKRKKNDFS